MTLSVGGREQRVIFRNHWLFLRVSLCCCFFVFILIKWWANNGHMVIMALKEPLDLHVPSLGKEMWGIEIVTHSEYSLESRCLKVPGEHHLSFPFSHLRTSFSPRYWEGLGQWLPDLGVHWNHVGKFKKCRGQARVLSTLVKHLSFSFFPWWLWGGGRWKSDCSVPAVGNSPPHVTVNVKKIAEASALMIPFWIFYE